MNKLFLLCAAIMLIYCAPVDPRECDFISDCPANFVCANYKCKMIFPPPPNGGKLLPGSTILPCDCYNDPWMWTGKTDFNSLCVSNSQIVQQCYGCCRDHFYYGCEIPTLGIFCQ